MKEFLFVFRAYWKKIASNSPEEMQARTKKWMDWENEVASRDKLPDRGKR